MNDSPRARLEAAYRNTVYRVRLPDGVADIRIGATSVCLDHWLAEAGAQSWAFVTACNPRSVRLGDADNAARHRALLRRVKRQGWPALSGEGIGVGWPPEPSVLIAGIGLDDALRLAGEFDQLAIVAGDHGMPARLVWLDADRQR